MFKVLKTLILLGFMVLSNVNFAIANNDEFQIQEIQLDFNIKDIAIKLNNGNVLFGINAIFNPKENKFYKTKFYNTDKKYDIKIKLKDDNILLINSYPAADEHFYSNIYNLIKYNFETKYYDIYYPSKKFSSEYYKNNQIENPKIKTEFKNYWENEYISKKDKEKIYLPFIKRNAKLYEEYQKYIKLLDENSYAHIYNPTTDELRIIGKRKIKDKISYYKVLKDGRILFIYNSEYENSCKMEIFNPKDEDFHILKNETQAKLKSAYLLENGNILFTAYYKNSKKNLIYSPKTGDFTEVISLENLKKQYPKDFNYQYSLNLNPKNNYQYIKNDDYFYIIENRKNVLKVNKDGATPSYKKIGTLHIARHYPKYIILKSGNLFLYVGRKYYIDGSSNLDYRAEILNVKTGKSKIIDDFKNFYDWYNFILLDDGRVLFFPLRGNKVFLLSE